MTAFYCDISAVGNEYQAYAATPTWGGGAGDKPLPMDGTGLAGPGHSAAVAIAEIQITVQPANTNTLVIAGATITAATAAAAKNQFTIGGTIAATVTNIVALLNTYGTSTAQCDAAVNTGTSKMLLALPHWQFARVKPGATDTVQIATRLAGADLNHASNSNVAITASGWGTPPTITQFAGGANGPFAYYLATTAVFGRAAMLYGIWNNLSPGPSDATTVSDWIIVRTERSGANLTLSYTASGAVTPVSPSNIVRQYIYDDGTTWTGDDGQFTLTIIMTTANALQFGCNVNGAFRHAARKKWGFKLRVQGYSFSYIDYLGYQYGTHIWENVEFETLTATTALHISGNTANSIYTYIGCKFTYAGQHQMYATHDSNTYGTKYTQIGCEFYWPNATANAGSFHLLASGAFSTGVSYSLFSGCTFVVGGGVYRATAPVAGPWSISTQFAARFENCSGLVNATAGITASAITALGAMVWDDCSDDRQFRVETSTYAIDWQNGAGIPTYNTTMPNGTPFAHRITWQSTRLTDSLPVNASRYSSYYKDTSGTKTITLEILAPSVEVPTAAQMFMVVKYTDTSDVIRIESSGVDWGQQLTGTAAALSAGVGLGAWTLNGATGVSSHKLAITTQYQVKQNTEIVADVWLRGPPTSSYLLYINPDLIIS